MDLTKAYQMHMEWKERFRRAISNHEIMDVAMIASDNCCDLGKWLHGEAKNDFGGRFTYEDCVSKHAAFHAEAGLIAETINQGKFEEAERMLNSTRYQLASQTVGYAIFKLKENISP